MVWSEDSPKHHGVITLSNLFHRVLKLPTSPSSSCTEVLCKFGLAAHHLAISSVVVDQPRALRLRWIRF